MHAQPRKPILAHSNLEHFFLEAVEQAAAAQQLQTRRETVFYLATLLKQFSRADALLEETSDGPQFAPLAHYYGVSQTAPTRAERMQALNRLGDVALFIAGLFQASLARKPVDVDYYAAMGGAAYATLADHDHAQAPVYSELAEKFVDFIDVLATVGEDAHTGSDRDVLRIYEVWLRTGSRRCAKQLRKAGIEPLRHGGASRTH